MLNCLITVFPVHEHVQSRGISRFWSVRPRLGEVARSQKPQKQKPGEAKLGSAAFWDPAFSAPPLCVPLRSTAAAFRCVPWQLRSGICVLLRSGLFCVLGATALRSAAFQGCCVPLRSAFPAFWVPCVPCVPLLAAFCVLRLLSRPAFLRSGFLRSAFRCVLRKLRSCVPAFPAFCVPGFPAFCVLPCSVFHYVL